MSDKKTAIIFARVACEDQEKKLLEQQVESCRSFAKENGLEIVGVFQFYGAGKEEKHIEFMTQISEMDKRPDLVLCKSLDRFSRDVFSGLRIIQFLSDFGINIQTIDEQYINSRKITSVEQDNGDMISVLPEPSSPSTRLIQNMEFAIAQFGDDIKVERVISWLQEKFRQGYWLWKAPHGYVRDVQTKELLVDENASKVVLDIFQQLSKSTEENRQQIIFNLAVKHKFSLVSLEKLVQNPFYAGEMYSASWDMWVTGKHKPLIDWDTWLKCQKSIK